MPALQRSVATGVAGAVSREPLVEGVFPAGSLVGDGADPFSDVDLGIVTIDGTDQAALADVLLLGRRPRSLSEFLEDHRDSFTESGPWATDH
jgi:hypothetical protein